MSQILIGLAGHARVGKDTAAQYLEAHHTLISYAFADPLKQALASMFNLADTQLEGPAKELPLTWLGKSPRELMQLLGTEWGRDLVHPQLWLLLAEQKLQLLAEHDQSMNGVVIRDVRFENEADWVRNKGGVIFHISRRGIRPANGHVSESGVRHNAGDYVIENDGTLEELYSQLDRAASNFIRRERAA
ncbi:deoxynucleotide monophosphate kinase [Pseudomonas sichuanensis]|uniref:deoxynucleotide monophosphate kinase family protein n=1 Tax=Pseudomonas sichuanensis TaxID=2213015 RepID=UPI000DA6C36F|nr:deoxynucleotide monophosphate kinase [Pseudomonas sichuanensis]